MRSSFLIVTLLLAACSQDAEAPVDSEVTPTDTDDAEVLAPGETSLADPTDTGPTREAEATRIPANFTGAWDYVESDCDGLSDLRMDVFPDRIEFYESIGTVESVEVENPNTVVVGLAMEGEGETWNEETRLTLSNRGERLTPINADGNQIGTPMPLKRCEG